MTGLLIGDIARRGALLSGDRPAFVWEGRTRTHRELADRSARTQTVLADAGVREGSRVAILSPNTPEVIETFFGASRLGAVIVPLNTRLHADDLRFQADDAGAEHVLVHPSLEGTARAAGLLERRCWAIGPEWDDLVASADPAPDGPRPADTSPVMQLYTSGTTGRPKGCLLTNRGWIAANANLAHSLRLGAEDRLLGVYPFFHVAGFGLATTHLMVGGTVALASSLAPDDLWGLVDEQRLTVAGFPGLRATARHPSAERAARHLRVVYGGAGMESRETLETVMGVASQAMWRGIYGSTEAGNVAATTTLSDELERPGTVGRPLLCYDASVRDDAFAEVPVGEAGELALRGPSTMIGYAGLPDATAAAMQDGWVRTGDLMRLDADGYLYFLDRVKDMIYSGGENVFSVEVEGCLVAHPSVVDVAVIGVPDERWGETVKAIVVWRAGSTPDADELDRHCRERIAGYKRPRQYEFVAEIPRSPTSKIVKKDLRAAHDPNRVVRPR